MSNPSLLRRQRRHQAHDQDDHYSPVVTRAVVNKKKGRKKKLSLQATPARTDEAVFLPNIYIQPPTLIMQFALHDRRIKIFNHLASPRSVQSNEAAALELNGCQFSSAAAGNLFESSKLLPCCCVLSLCLNPHLDFAMVKKQLFNHPEKAPMHQWMAIKMEIRARSKLLKQLPLMDSGRSSPSRTKSSGQPGAGDELVAILT